MNIISHFKVTEAAMRPASPIRQCFYCQQPIGAFHLRICVLIKRKAVIQATIKYEIEVPANWSAEFIEEHRSKDGTWCYDNFVDEINSLHDALDEKHSCMCEADLEFKCVELKSDIKLEEE